MKKVIEIPAEPADPADLPPLLQGFKAVPPLVTRHQPLARRPAALRVVLGHRRARQYDVTDPFTPKLTATTQIGGIVRRAAHPAQPSKRLNGGPQMVELSRDGRRVYLTNALYSPWDAQFYPDGIESWMVKLDTRPEGGMALDPQVLPGDGAGPPLPPGAAPGRRRVVRLVLLLVMIDATSMSWPALLALGAGHGINPAMGWLFAVALGLQRGSRGAVWGALGAARGRARAGDRRGDRCRRHGGTDACRSTYFGGEPPGFWSASASSGWCARGTPDSAGCR